MDLSYVIIIITAVLAILGLIAKTKKDDKPGLLNSLTPFGIIVLVLLFSSLVANIFIQIEKDRKNKEEKDAALNEKNAAIDKARRDSITARNNFLIDSLGHQLTIKALREESKLNALKSFNDSLRFSITYAKSQEILNPLFPLKLSANFFINLRSLQPYEKRTLREFLDYFSNAFKNKKLPRTFNYNIFEHHEDYEPPDTIIELDAFSPTSPSTFKDSVINEFNLFIYRKIMPELIIYLYKDRNVQKLNRNTANIVLITDQLFFNQPIVQYKIYQDELAIVNLTLEEPNFEKNDGEIKSALTLKDGLIAVSASSYYYYCPSITLKDLFFHCGLNYNQTYPIYFNKEDLKYCYVDEKYDSVYIKKGKSK
jgi:hypothetical protein